MVKPLVVVAGSAIVLAIGLAWVVPHFTRTPELEFVDLTRAQAAAAVKGSEESVGLCGWQKPEADQQQFFPCATGYRDEYIGLSQQRDVLARRLHRPPNEDENRLQAHRILHGEAVVGTVLTRRLRGESGAMELVLAVDNGGNVVGAKVQRLREPDAVAKQLQSSMWLAAFRGKTANSPWQAGKDVPAVSPDAQKAARTLLDGARAALVCLDVSRSNPPPQAASPRSPALERPRSTP